MKAISKSKHDQVKYHLENGQSVRKVTSICGFSKSPVHELRATINTSLVNNPDGPQTKLSSQLQRCYIHLMITSNMKTTAEMAQTINNEFGVNVSSMAISRTLRNNSLKSIEKLLKLMLF